MALATRIYERHPHPLPGQGRRGRLVLEGGLAIYDIARIKPMLIEAISLYPELEVDLSGIDAIDTSGIQLLILAKTHARSVHHQLHLVAHSPSVVEMFELFHLAGYFGDPIILPAPVDNACLAS